MQDYLAELESSDPSSSSFRYVFFAFMYKLNCIHALCLKEMRCLLICTVEIHTTLPFLKEVFLRSCCFFLKKKEVAVFNHYSRSGQNK